RVHLAPEATQPRRPGDAPGGVRGGRDADDAERHRRDVATLSFLADDNTAKRVLALLDGVGVRWRLRRRRAMRHGGINADDGLVSRQWEVIESRLESRLLRYPGADRPRE